MAPKAIMTALSVPLAVVAIMPAAAFADTFLDVNAGLTGWTTQGTTSVMTTTETSNHGGSPFTLTPATGEAMVKIEADGSIIDVSTVDSILGLTNGTASAAIAGNSTNFGLITKSFSLQTGTYTFGWAYSAGDYLPYSDGVFFSLGGQGVSQFNILARNGETSIVPGSAGYPTGALILQSYGNTPWITASFSVSTAGSYQLGFGGFNALDDGLSPILYVSSVIGTYTGTPVGTSGGTPTSTDIDTAAPGGYDAAQLGTSLNAVFAGGTLYFTTPGAFSQNFQLGNSATNTIDLRDVSVNLDGDLTDQTTGGSIIFANTGSVQTAIMLNGNSTYTGATTIENNVLLNLYGSINNTSSIQIKNGALVMVRNGASITAGHITNELGGQLLIQQGGTVTDDLDNAGDVENAGTYNAIVNTNTGTILNTATGEWNGEVRSNTNMLTNAGIWNGDIASSGYFGNNGTLNGDLSVSGWGTADNSNVINGNVTLVDGNFNNTGTVDGNLSNNASFVGMSTVTGGGIITGSVTNSGTIEVTGDMTTGAITNSGDVTVFGNTSLTAAGLTSDANGRAWVNANATLNSSVSNAGYFRNSGTVNGALNANSGDIGNAGVWNGDVLSNADWIYSTGTWNGAVTANSGTVFNAGTWNGDVTNAGEFVSTGTFTGTLNTSGEAYLYGVINGAVTNTGTFTLQGNLTGNGSAFNNSGTLRIDDNGFNGFGAVTNVASGEIWVGGFGSAGVLNAASLSNAGALHMANGRAGDIVNVTGAYTGIAGSVLSFDVDMLTGQADRLNVGTLSGTSTVRLNNSAAGRTYLSAPVVLVSSGGGDGALTADTDIGTNAVLGSQSLMSYRLAKIAGTSDWGIVSSLNTPSLTSLSASLTAYVTAQNLNLADLPEEVFVRDGAYGVNQWMANSWARAYSGDLSLKSGFATSDGYSSGTTTKAKSSQDGVQYGFDAGVYNIHGTGVSLRAGFMGGSTDAKVTDEILSGSSVKIDAPNYGYYAALTHKGLRLSVQNRHEVLKADVTNPALGLSNSRLKARSETMSVVLSNRYDLNSLFVEPVIGYMMTKVDADTLNIPADQGSVKIASLKSKLIRAGVRVGTEFTTERVIWTPYGELNAWQEDAAKTQTAYVPEGGSGAVWLAGQRTGAFGQALVGVTAQSRTNENLSGHLTADARLGDTLNGWTVRAGVKYRLK
jgi:cytoskeletal protein CcmA (bactofilin family)